MTPAAYRASVLQAVLPALEAEPEVVACWEGGSQATGRIDDYSDIDLVIVAPLAASDTVFAALENAIESLAAIEHRWPVEPAPFPGTRQRFYLLAGAPPFFAVDCVIVEPDATAQFLERERHGEPRVYFDRSSTIAAVPLDSDALAARRSHRIAQMRAALPVFRMLVAKELARGRPLEAHGFYLVLLRYLLEILGARHRPDRYDFGWRYVETELPPDARDQLRHYAFVGDAEALGARAAELGAELQRLLDSGT